MPAINVIADLRGEEEPDRQVILGNHRDAWVFGMWLSNPQGASDPNAGSVAMIEVARYQLVLSKLM